MKNFFNQLQTTRIKVGDDEDRINLLDAVKQYINTGVCIQYRNKMDYLPWLWGRKSEEVAKILGVSAATVRTATVRMSGELFEQFGYNFYDLVENDLPAARDIFTIVKNYRGLDTLFLPGFTQLLPAPASSDSIEIEDCREEIRFLKQFTQNSVSNGLSGLDHNRLCYVLDLLGDVNGGRDRFNLIRVLQK